MAWERLPENYTDAVWSGLKRYTEVNNEDGTVSFQDVTVYTNREKSFFGAKDANRMNQALNIIMSMVENGTDLYTAFLEYFSTQKELFESNADLSMDDFLSYIAVRKAEADKIVEDLETDYREEITRFETTQEQVFNTWFDFIKGQFGEDVAGNLQNQINDLKVYVDGKHLTATVILPAASWVGDAVPYTQTMAVKGITKDDTPHYGVVYAADQETRLAQKEAFALVDDLETADGNVTFTCFEDKPDVDLEIQLEVNR